MPEISKPAERASSFTLVEVSAIFFHSDAWIYKALI